MTKPVVLAILDGWGIALSGPGNAVSLAKTPNFDSFWAAFPHTQLQASGEVVGLPRGEVGNSETGHLNLGAGRIVYQDLPRIDMSIADGSFFENSALLSAVAHCQKNKSALHLLGLLGQGGVHSNIAHLFALLRLAKDKKLDNVYLHLFSDGRDSPQTSCPLYLSQLEKVMKDLNVGKVATLVGRYFAMDRDNHWDRTEVAYRAIAEGKGEQVDDLKEAIQQAYQKGKTDEFLEPLIVKGVPRVQENDAVIFFNFRIDRPRQLTKAFVIPDFKNLIGQKIAFDPYTEKYYKKTYIDTRISSIFDRGPKIKNLSFVTMTEYENDLPVESAFPPVRIALPMGKVISEKGLRQLRLTETEKERFVTYYFNGQQEKPFSGEDRIIVPSPSVATYDKQPEMSAIEVNKILEENIKQNIYDFILVNYANPDMVGHTGVIPAGIKACETVDECIGRIGKIVLGMDGVLIITADHGNVEEMINLETGQIDTEHSKNPVPFIIVGKSFQGNRSTLPMGILADVAPTILSFLDIKRPAEMLASRLLK
ncbi:MAG: 2,3-bisphosphoglycerate-independent phosphoglycerate mutase [bacterium]|nr:2,3-bisphosphoglycerate-independent phosphoglycerate mutase [bacterium]